MKEVHDYVIDNSNVSAPTVAFILTMLDSATVTEGFRTNGDGLIGVLLPDGSPSGVSTLGVEVSNNGGETWHELNGFTLSVADGNAAEISTGDIPNGWIHMRLSSSAPATRDLTIHAVIKRF